MFLPCLPCCGLSPCQVADGKPRTDPATEGHWVPTGTWATSVTWTFSSSPSTTDGGTWFFYGSASTSKVGGGATTAEQRDWGNICNWYSNKTTTPSSTLSLTTVLDKRATKLPPTDAIVHFYSDVSTASAGPQTVKNAYFWGSSRFVNASTLTTSSSAHDSSGGSVLNSGSRNDDGSTINGGATLNDSSWNYDSSTINGGAVFYDSSENRFASTINGGATFFDTSENVDNSVVNGGAIFNGLSVNDDYSTVNDGATFNDSSVNSLYSTVNGGATFNDFSRNSIAGTVNGGATFNDAACSNRTIGSFFSCPGVGRRTFVAHPTDLPTCNGTAPDGCVSLGITCGCG